MEQFRDDLTAQATQPSLGFKQDTVWKHRNQTFICIDEVIVYTTIRKDKEKER